MSVNAVPKFTRWTAEFYALMLWTILGSMLLASAAELFTIFLSLQLTSLPLIVLVGYAKRDPRSGEAALKYLLLVLVSTAVLLYGMSLIYGSLGTSTLSEIAKTLASDSSIDPIVAMGLVLLLTGFAFKITAAPFHYWVPDAYEGAPTPVTAFMSVGSKFAGFALALRVIVTAERVPLNWSLIFGVMAAISMTLGNLGCDPPEEHQADACLLGYRSGRLPARRSRRVQRGGHLFTAVLHAGVRRGEPGCVRGRDHRLQRQQHRAHRRLCGPVAAQPA